MAFSRNYCLWCSLSEMAVEEHGHIIHQSSPYMSQTNILEKWIDQILLNKTHFMLEHACTSKLYWGDAIKQAADLKNETAAKDEDLWTLIKAFQGTTPTHSNLRILGCAAYPQIHKKMRVDRFEQRAEKWISLGNAHVLLRIFKLTILRIILTKHAFFNRNLFPISEDSPVRTNARMERKPTMKMKKQYSLAVPAC